MSPDAPEDPTPGKPADEARVEPKDDGAANKAEAAAKAAKAAADAKADAKENADDEAKDKAKDKAKDEAKAKKEAAHKAEKAAEDEADAKAKAADKAKKEADRKAAAEREEAAERTAIPKAPPWYRTLRADPPAHIRLLLGLALISVVFGIWWFLTRGYDVSMQFNGRTKVLELKIVPSVDRIISAVKLPSPGEVFGSFGTLLDRDISKNTIETLQRVAAGVGLAALFGVFFGVLAAAHRGVNAAIAPLVIFLRSVPMGALIPLTLMLFGDGEKQKTRFIFLAILPFVFSDTVKAVSIVPDRYIETAQTLGASRWQIIRKVLVPLALPDIITSLRFQLGLALGYIMLAEEINTEYGLGHLILSSQREGPFEHVYMLLFVIALLAFMIDYLLRTIQRGIFAWRKDL